MFSQDCRATVVQHSHDIHTSGTTFVLVSQRFRIVNSPKFRGDKLSTLARTSHDILAKYIGEKIRIKFLNTLKNSATSSRLVRDT